MMKGSLRIYCEKEKDRVANGTHICWLITAECLYERHQQTNSRDKRHHSEFLMVHLFLGRILYIDTIFTF